MEKLIPLLTIGGTFDVLHKGHWFILEESFNVADRVLIGLTTDEFVRSMKKSHAVDCFEKRLKELKRFLGEKGFLERSEITPISDRYGPTVGENSQTDEIGGIVVSEETEPAAEEINRIRVREEKKPLLIVVVSMVLADDGKPISSTRIRRQEVDRYGRLIG